MRTMQRPYQDAAICQQAAESLAKRGELSWCSRQWLTVIARWSRRQAEGPARR